LAVFYPGLLAGFMGAIFAGWGRNPIGRVGAGALLTALVAANFWVWADFRRSMAPPPLRVDRSFPELGQLEGNPRVDSLNMQVDDFWSRLWANAFLLKKRQYFATHTYEGRLNTALKGSWDLQDSLLRSVPFRPDDHIFINEHFHANHVGAPGLVGAVFGSGWHALEGSGLNRWRWAAGPAQVEFFNPGREILSVDLNLVVRSLQPVELQVELNGQLLGMQPISAHKKEREFRTVSLPPGRSILTLQTNLPAVRGGHGDERLLSVSLHHLDIRARRPD
jgi:hypothetical protein